MINVKETTLSPKLIFTSRGLNTRLGTQLIGEELKKDNLQGKTILLISHPSYEIDDYLVDACKSIGFEEKNIILSGQLFDEILSCEDTASKDAQSTTVLKNKDRHFDYVYCGEGNTFEIVDYMRKYDLFYYAKKYVQEGAVYIGSSAGAIIAGQDFELATDFDDNYLHIRDYTGLELFEGTIIPHYEPDELERYIANTEEYRISQYKKIYSVGNEEIVVLC